jgi:hypothetical protein
MKNPRRKMTSLEMTMKVRTGYLMNQMKWWSSIQGTIILLQRVLEGRKTYQSKKLPTPSHWWTARTTRETLVRNKVENPSPQLMNLLHQKMPVPLRQRQPHKVMVGHQR